MMRSNFNPTDQNEEAPLDDQSDREPRRICRVMLDLTYEG